MDSELHLEEDYIHMEVSSYSNLFPHNNNNGNPREFEFQMSSTTLRGERDTSASPADELFYKGKLLPLHLPPRLQMVEKILETSKTFDPSFSSSRSFDLNNCEFFSTPLMTTAPTPTATSTPFESCPVSPSDSFRIGREITRPEESYAREEYSAELWRNNGEDVIVSDKKLICEDPGRKNSKAKHLSLGSRLKASRAYLKSLFGISGCSDESSTAARKVADEGSAMKYVKVNNNKNGSSGGQIIPRNTTHHHHKFPNPSSERNCHRRSFSLALRRHSTIAKSKCVSTSSSSSSSSLSSSESSSLSQSKYLKRCGSINNKCSESENSIQGAIAHCKKSQLVFSSRSSVSPSRIGICEEQETQQLCRG